MKSTIDLKAIFHKNAEQIGIYLKDNQSLNIIIRKEANGIIKELSGHFNIRTTERYLQVAKEKLITIGTPLHRHSANEFLWGH